MSTKTFMHLFRGRTDCYGMNSICLKEPPTQEIYNQHLKGDKRIGVYPITQDNKTSWLSIDIDEPNFDMALSIRDKARHYKLHAYIERSKSKGHHVWIFFDKPVEAVKPRMIAELILKELELKCEIFPKQDEINERAPYGNFIFLPLFGGDVKQGKTVFINSANQVIVKNDIDIEKIRLTEVTILDEIIEVNNLSRDKREISPAEKVSTVSVLKGTLPCIEKIKEGNLKEGDGRNECAFRLTIFYKERGMGREDIHTLLVSWNSKNIEGMSKKEIDTVIESVFKGKYKSFGCDSAIIQKFCDKDNCSFIQSQDRKEKIDQGIITLVFRDEVAMVFRKKDYEYRLTNFSFSRGGKFTCSLSLSRSQALVFKDILTLDKASMRKKFVLAAKDPEIDIDLIKIDELTRKQFEKEEKEKLDKPKQLYVMTETEKVQAMKFLESKPHILYDVIKITNDMGVVGEEVLRLMVYLCFTSRITKEPISITVKGEASSGKSFGCQCVKKLIPEEGYHFITRATQQAFFHLREDGMQHRIIYINELPGSESADYSIRSSQSEGDLILMLPVKDPVTGDMETKEKRVRGPCGFLVTTTKASMFNENETRNFSLFTDDSPNLTKAIGDITARKALGETFDIHSDRLNMYKNVQRLLNSEFKVIIPYAREVFNAFPDKPVRIRRDRERFRELIEIITLLHQFHRTQKKENGKVILIATLADYYIAKLIAEDTLLHTIFEIGPSSKEVWQAIMEMEEEYNDFIPDIESCASKGSFTFKYKDVSDHLKWKPEKTKKWALTLVLAGIIEYSEESVGGRGKAAILKISGSTKRLGEMLKVFLPSVETLWKLYPCDPNLFYNPISGMKINPEFADAPSE